MNVLLLKAGEASPMVRLSSGDYDRWFLQTAARPGVRFEVVKAYLGEKLPPVTAHDAIIMTGSSFSATQPEPWMLAAAEYLRMAAAREIPVLGVCFGHQLLSLAFGGRVTRNPKGREIGTVEVQLCDAGADDYLFRGIPRSFAVQTTHEDEVPELPSGARQLATNGFSRIQAMAIGDHVRGVQFHPELQPDAMRNVVSARAEKLEADAVARGAPPGERLRTLLEGLRPTPFGRRLLHNFLDQAAALRGVS